MKSFKEFLEENVHRVKVVVSHEPSSQHNVEKIEKVIAPSKKEAVEKAKTTFRNYGYTIHHAEHMGETK